MRKWDCWCDACLQISGRGEGNMSGYHRPTLNRKLSQFEVQGCVGPCRGLKNVFDERRVKPLQKGSTQERVEAEHFGRELVLNGKVGDFVGIQNRAGDEDGTFWVAQLADSQRGNRLPHIYERVQERHKQIEHNFHGSVPRARRLGSEQNDVLACEWTGAPCKIAATFVPSS